MPDIVHIIHEIEDPALRALARAISTHGLSRQAALDQLHGWRAAVPFDQGERVLIEQLYDATNELIDDTS